jgi:hypothetical protein
MERSPSIFFISKNIEAHDGRIWAENIKMKAVLVLALAYQ